MLSKKCFKNDKVWDVNKWEVNYADIQLSTWSYNDKWYDNIVLDFKNLCLQSESEVV